MTTPDLYPCFMQAADLLSPMKIYWLRGCGYILTAVLMGVVYWYAGGGKLMLVFAIMIFLDGLCYCGAHAKGESEEREEGYDALERGTAPAGAAGAAGAASPQ